MFTPHSPAAYTETLLNIISLILQQDSENSAAQNTGKNMVMRHSHTEVHHLNTIAITMHCYISNFYTCNLISSTGVPSQRSDDCCFKKNTSSWSLENDPSYPEGPLAKNGSELHSTEAFCRAKNHTRDIDLLGLDSNMEYFDSVEVMNSCFLIWMKSG